MDQSGQFTHVKRSHAHSQGAPDLELRPWVFPCVDLTGQSWASSSTAEVTPTSRMSSRAEEALGCQWCCDETTNNS